MADMNEIATPYRTREDLEHARLEAEVDLTRERVRQLRIENDQKEPPMVRYEPGETFKVEVTPKVGGTYAPASKDGPHRPLLTIIGTVTMKDRVGLGDPSEFGYRLALATNVGNFPLSVGTVLAEPFWVGQRVIIEIKSA